MAISDDLPGVKVEVVVRGTKLEEHDYDDTEEQRTITKYVEATSGQIFAVLINLLPSFEFQGGCIEFEVEADGMKMGNHIITQHSGHRSKRIEGRRLSDTSIEKFQFNTLHIGNEGSRTDAEASPVKHLGSVVIKCSHRLLSRQIDPVIPTRLNSPGIVSEQVLKGQAISHNIKFKTSERCDTANWFDTVPVSGLPNPVATFVFRYRSLAALKAMLIVPRTPTPTPSPSPEPIERRAPEALSRDDIEELQRRLQAAEAAQNKDDAKEKVKREEDDNPRPRKRERPSAGIPLVEIDDDGTIHESIVAPNAAGDEVVIELD